MSELQKRYPVFIDIVVYTQTNLPYTITSINSVLLIVFLATNFSICHICNILICITMFLYATTRAFSAKINALFNFSLRTDTLCLIDDC